MTTGLSAKTFQNLQLNAGIFLTGFDFTAATDAATLKTKLAAAIQSGEGYIGATRGGGSFECTPEIRNIDADGMRYEFVGSTVNDKWTIKLKTTLLESTPENFQKALMSADVVKAESGNMKTVKIRTDIRTSDYIPSLCWVGDTSKGYVLIKLDNALNTTGATFSFSDKGEGTLPVEFTAHQASLKDDEFAPVQIVFFETAAASE